MTTEPTDTDTGADASELPPDEPADIAAAPEGWGIDPDAPAGVYLDDMYPDPGTQVSAYTDPVAPVGPYPDSPPVAPPAHAATPYPRYAQYDPAVDFEPPEDLPPWYEDEFYDDRDWERLPRRTSTIFRVLAFCGVLLVAGFFAYNYVDGWWQDQLDPPGEPGEIKVIEIPQGATTNDIARILADEDIVANGTVFRYWLRFKGADDGYQAGTYTFQVNSSVGDVREILEAGPLPQDDNRVFITVPEGLTVDELQDVLLAQLPLFDAAELSDAVNAANRPEVFASLPLFSAEGIFFPETYDVDQLGQSDELSLLNRMTAQFDLVARETDLETASAELGVSPYQALIVASLIEEEARVDEDRAKIARVIYNRLADGTPLGIDATIVYALDGDRELDAEDLAVDSPYNTRLYAGLPPSPIAAPGRASIEAALNPEPGDWQFYVRTDEFGPGTHTFTVTAEDFEAAVQVCIERDLGCG